MPKKNKLYLCTAVLLLFLAYFLYKRSHGKVEIQRGQSALLTKHDRSSPANDSSAPPESKIAQSIFSSDSKRPKRDVPPLFLHKLNAGESSADFALMSVLFRHPELDLTPETAAAIQSVFSEHHAIYEKYEASLAEVTQQPDKIVGIKIPAFPLQGEQLMGKFLADVDGFYQGNAPRKVVDALAEAYRGYTNGAGQNAVSLLVKTNNDGSYSISRDISFFDPKTGTLIGSGHTDDYYSKKTILNGDAYPELSKHFPSSDN